MNVFGAYARYYDLLYEDKDYDGEAQYVNSLINRFAPDSLSLLDIGCGTGRHAELFSEMGFGVHGLDRSVEMISRAKSRNLNIEFTQGDLCCIRLNKKFDVISALFHVISYLATDDELRSAFNNVRGHLKQDGLFIFDCWHGPAVLHQKPEVRIKRLQSGSNRVCRIAEPRMLSKENRVDVNYQIFVKENELWSELNEIHPMRYLFQPEIDTLLSGSGMQLLHSEEWLTGNKPSPDTWSVVYVVGVE